MKNLITLFIFLISLSFSGFAQQVKSTKDTSGYSKLPVYPVKKISPQPVYNNALKKQAYTRKLNKDTSDFIRSPLYVVKFQNQQFKISSWSILSLLPQNDIQAMEIYSGKKADSLYYGTGKNGVIIITVNKAVNTSTKKALFEKYNIRKKYTNLPVYIDSALTKKVDNDIFAIDFIKTITIAKDKETGEKYISIITTVGPNKNIRGTDFRIPGNNTIDSKG